MNGKQHLRGGIAAGIISAGVVYTEYHSMLVGNDMTVNNRLFMSVLLAPIFGYMVPKKFNKIEHLVKGTVKNVSKSKGKSKNKLANNAVDGVSTIATLIESSPRLLSILVVLVTALILFIATSFPIGRLITYSLLGGAIGSLLPDLDSPRAESNKIINRLSIGAPVVIGLLFILKFPPVVDFFGGAQIGDIVTNGENTLKSVNYSSVGITGFIAISLILLAVYNVLRLISKMKESKKNDKKEMNIVGILAVAIIFYMFPIFKDSLINTYHILNSNNFSAFTSSIHGALTQLCVIVFLLNCILSKMSEHRKYTHQLVGSGVYFVTAWVIFPHIFAMGFILGYISHWILDWTTPAGLNPFVPSMPCVWKGKFNPKQGFHHMKNSLKAGKSKGGNKPNGGGKPNEYSTPMKPRT